MKHTRICRGIALVLAVLMVFSLAACGAQKLPANANTSGAATAEPEQREATPAEPGVYSENGLPVDQKVTLKWGFWHTIPANTHHMDYVEEFTKKFPNVTIEVTATPTIAENIKTMLSAGDDKNMFDVFTYSDWIQLQSLGKLQACDDLYERVPYDAKEGDTRKYKDLLMDGVYEQSSRAPDGKIYYMPSKCYIAGLFYDQNLFEEHGWNQDPKTWDEFVELLRTIKTTGIIPMVYAGVYGYDLFTFRPKQFELAAINGKLDAYRNYRERKLPFYNTPENRETWQREYDLAKEGLLDPNCVSLTHTQTQMMVIQHKAALVASGDWIQSEMQKDSPEFDSWGFMAVPFVTDPNQSIYISNGVNSKVVAYAAGKDELTQKWAKEFLFYIQNINWAEHKEFGRFSLRKDYYENEEAVNGQKGIQKACMDYIGRHKVVLVDMNANDSTLTHPNVSKAAKLYTSNGALVAAGKMEVGPFLEELDALLKVAVDEEAAEK